MGQPLRGQDIQVVELIGILRKVVPLHEALFFEGPHAVAGLAKAHSQGLRLLALGPNGVGVDQPQKLQVEITMGIAIGKQVSIMIAVGGGHGLFQAIRQNLNNRIISKTISCSRDEQLLWQFITLGPNTNLAN